MKPRFFTTPAEFRKWLEKHHASETELWVGFHKKASGKPSLTWPEAVEEALCFGWIDGVRHSLDETSYTNRFTPRKPTSNWSLINVNKVAELIASGRMRPAGLRAFEQRAEARTGIYSFEQRAEAKLDRAMERRFRSDEKAWAYWQSCPPGYRKIATFWVVSAKQDETRQRRLGTLIDDSSHGRRLAQLRPAKKR
jgi:uncharacterized protein YdeI (YjbR/CyaY-like superfamily)